MIEIEEGLARKPCLLEQTVRSLPTRQGVSCSQGESGLSLGHWRDTLIFGPSLLFEAVRISQCWPDEVAMLHGLCLAKCTTANLTTQSCCAVRMASSEWCGHTRSCSALQSSGLPAQRLHMLSSRYADANMQGNSAAV